jgi:hypothetical protein
MHAPPTRIAYGLLIPRVKIPAVISSSRVQQPLLTRYVRRQFSQSAASTLVLQWKQNGVS